MFHTLREDFSTKAAHYGLPPTPRSIIRMLVSDGSMALILYRFMRFCQTHHLKLLGAIVYRLNASTTHTIIGRNADIGPGFVILHSFGVVINTNVRAGRNLIVYHGVTLGEEKNLSPVLGDNILIGAGAKVLGNVRIGSDVKIGANAVVIRDLPDGATAVGIPAQVIKVYGERVISNERQLRELCVD